MSGPSERYTTIAQAAIATIFRAARHVVTLIRAKEVAKAGDVAVAVIGFAIGPLSPIGRIAILRSNLTGRLGLAT